MNELPLPDWMPSPEGDPRYLYRWPAGPHLWEVCDRCNFNRHTCHFCGDDLRHAEDDHTNRANLHACYLDTAEEACHDRAEV